MNGHFLPFGYMQSLFQRLQALRQGARFIDDYTEEFYQLIARNDLSETKEQLVARYLGGLRQSLQDVLSLHSLQTVSEAYQRALVVEKQQARNNTKSAPRGDQNARGFRLQEPRLTPQSTQGQSSNPNIHRFKCEEPGHRSTECRKPTSRTGKNLLIEDETIEEDVDVRDPIYDDCNGDGDDEEVLYGDGNATLVVRKNLLAPKDNSKED